LSISASSATVQAASRESENAFGAGIFKAFKSENVNEWIVL